jgi:hypothetical protein
LTETKRKQSREKQRKAKENEMTKNIEKKDEKKWTKQREKIQNNRMTKTSRPSHRWSVLISRMHLLGRKSNQRFRYESARVDPFPMALRYHTIEQPVNNSEKDFLVHKRVRMSVSSFYALYWWIL